MEFRRVLFRTCDRREPRRRTQGQAPRHTGTPAPLASLLSEALSAFALAPARRHHMNRFLLAPLVAATALAGGCASTGYGYDDGYRGGDGGGWYADRKSTRLNSSH